MFKKYVFLILFLGGAAVLSSAFAAPGMEKGEAKRGGLTAETILDRVEAKYASGAFSAEFFQESPLEAIQIVDTARGRAYFKSPGMLRWEYHEPDRIDYITDGETLWIFTPGDSQVWTGRADRFFGEGSGALFLADIKKARGLFRATLEKSGADFHVIKLVPKKEGTGLMEVELTISAVSYEISGISSLDVNGEETRIMFGRFDFDFKPHESMFRLEIPKNATVIPLE